MQISLKLVSGKGEWVGMGLPGVGNSDRVCKVMDMEYASGSKPHSIPVSVEKQLIAAESQE